MLDAQRKDDIMRTGNRPSATPSAAGAQAVGDVAVGAMAVGALAVGALAIGRLRVRSARIRRLEIDHLVVRNAGACPACGRPSLSVTHDAVRPETGTDTDTERAYHAGS
jgi:hypothetical protein